MSISIAAKPTTQDRAVYLGIRVATWRQIKHRTGLKAVMSFVRWIKHLVLGQRQAGADPETMEGAEDTTEGTASEPNSQQSAPPQAHAVPLHSPRTIMSTAEEASPTPIYLKVLLRL